MNEESDKPDNPGTVAPDGEQRGPMAGERLAEARRRQQISALEIAKELHLDEPKVRALEQNDFGVLSAPVFAKGHLRKYAQLVGVDFDDVLADYYQLTRSAGMPPVVLKRRKRVQEISPGPWIVAGIVVLLAMAAYWLLVASPISVLERPDPDIEAGSVSPMVADETASHAAEQQRPQAAVSIVDDTVADEVVTEASQPPVADGQLRLAVSYAADCWTEIVDATGQRLFYEMGRGGTSVEVSGEAPISVLFGNADSVSLRVNGADYSLAAAERRGETATLTLNAQ